MKFGGGRIGGGCVREGGFCCGCAVSEEEAERVRGEERARI